jgi:hypothetical protein
VVLGGEDPTMPRRPVLRGQAGLDEWGGAAAGAHGQVVADVHVSVVVDQVLADLTLDLGRQLKDLLVGRHRLRAGHGFS